MTKNLSLALATLFCVFCTFAASHAEPVGPRLPLHSAVSDFCARPTVATLQAARSAARSAHLRWMAVHHIEQARAMRSILPKVTSMVSPRTWRDGGRKPKAGAFDQSPTQRTLSMIGVAMHGFSSLKNVLFSDNLENISALERTRLCEHANVISWYVDQLTELSSARLTGLAPQDVRSLWRAAYLARLETAQSKEGLSPFGSLEPLLANYSLTDQQRQIQVSLFAHQDANAFVNLFEEPEHRAVGKIHRADVLRHTIMDLPARRLEAYLSHYMRDIRQAVILTLLKPDSTPLTGS